MKNQISKEKHLTLYIWHIKCNNQKTTSKNFDSYTLKFKKKTFN